MRLRNELTEEEYMAKKSSLILEKEKLKRLLEDTDTRQNKWLELSEKTFNFAHYARYWFNEGDIKQKRAILSTLGQNLILKDKKLNISLPKPFSMIQKALLEIPNEAVMLEPNKTALDKRKNTSLNTDVVSWLGSWDSNPGPIGYTLS